MPELSKTTRTYTIDLNDTSQAVELNVETADTMAVQRHVFSGAWGSGEITLEVSCDGQTFVAFPTPVTYSSDGIDTGVDVKPYARVRARVSTAAGSAALLRLALVLIAN